MYEGTDYIEITTTCDQPELADEIARMLVERRLAACVQRAPVRSVYRWKGHVEHAEEILLRIKTRRRLVPDVEEAVRAVHTYEEPEFLVLPVLGGSEGYLAWLDRETGPGRAQREGDDT